MFFDSGDDMGCKMLMGNGKVVVKDMGKKFRGYNSICMILVRFLL